MKIGYKVFHRKDNRLTSVTDPGPGICWHMLSRTTCPYWSSPAVGGPCDDCPLWHQLEYWENHETVAPYDTLLTAFQTLEAAKDFAARDREAMLAYGGPMAHPVIHRVVYEARLGNDDMKEIVPSDTDFAKSVFVLEQVPDEEISEEAVYTDDNYRDYALRTYKQKIDEIRRILECQ